MSAAKKRTPAPAEALKPGHFLVDGVEMVSINVSKHRVFAHAALMAWKAKGGPNYLRLLGFAKAVTVPADVLDDARKSLKPEETPQEFAQ